MTYWVLIIVTLYSNHVFKDTPLPFPTWESLGVFETQQACFTALERQQIARDMFPQAGVERYYRCNESTGKRP
jgi:hypothetical protein